MHSRVTVDEVQVYAGEYRMPTASSPGHFGELLQQYRAAAGLSQDELAQRAGLSQRGISDLERGRRRVPHLATVRRLVQALELDGADRAALLGATRPALPVAAEFGSPGVEAKPRHNLPVQLTTLVGRRTETAAVRQELARTRR